MSSADRVVEEHACYSPPHLGVEQAEARAHQLRLGVEQVGGGGPADLEQLAPRAVAFLGRGQDAATGGERRVGVAERAPRRRDLELEPVEESAPLRRDL